MKEGFHMSESPSPPSPEQLVSFLHSVSREVRAVLAERGIHVEEESAAEGGSVFSIISSTEAPIRVMPVPLKGVEVVYESGGGYSYIPFVEGATPEYIREHLEKVLPRE